MRFEGYGDIPERDFRRSDFRRQTGEDIEFIAFFLWKEVSPQVTEDSGFSAKIRGPQGLM